MILAVDPDQPRRRPKLAPCAYCEATARGCDTNRWLRGRSCCEACNGTHQPPTEGTTP